MIRAALTLIAALSLGACHAESSAPDGRDFPHVAAAIDRHAPSIADLENFTYVRLAEGTVTLTDGRWQGSTTSGNVATTVSLVKAFRLTGDITGNGTDEAVVLLQSTPAAGPPRLYVSVVGWIGAQLMDIATIAIDDGIEIQGGHVEPGHIVLDGVRSAGAPVHLRYVLEGTTLRLVASS